MKKYHVVTSDILEKAKQQTTQKDAIHVLLSANPYLKAKKVCELMEWDWHLSGRSVNQRVYEWRKSHKSGLGSESPNLKKSPDSQHHVYCDGKLPVFLDRRVPGIDQLFLDAKWTLSRNTNKTMLWLNDRSLGRIECFTGGTVRVHSKAVPRKKAIMDLLSAAFFRSGLILDPRHFSDFVTHFEWVSFHNVYNSPGKQRLPCFRIEDPFLRELGIRSIKIGDRTHRSGVEIEYVRDQVFADLRSWLEINRDAFKDFTEFMKTLSQPNHMKKDARRMYV